MNYNELCKEIAELGFEPEVEDDGRLLSAIRRAMKMIYVERPILNEVTLYQSERSNVIKIESFAHQPRSVESTNLTCRAYSFRTAGVGSYSIRSKDIVKTYSFSKNGEVHRGFLRDGETLEFLGDFSYTVYDISLFGELYSDDVNDIPVLSDYVEYNMTEHAEDFASFFSVPKAENGASINGVKLLGTKLKIPTGYFGKIRVVYKKRPHEISGNPDEEITVPSGCEHLTALLAASFVWLDDDAEKARYYMTLYREALSAVKYYDRAESDISYQNTNGWA